MPLRHRQHRIALLPLDDRPCNAKFPRALARMVDYDTPTPPPHLLGRFQSPGNCEELGTWLQRTAGEVDCAVVSLDMLAYGGLVASRTAATPLEVARRRLDVLRDIRQAHPDLSIYASSTIMRLSVTASSDCAARHGELVRRYSELISGSRSEEQQAELEEIEEELPPEVLGEYLAARARNHQLNCYAVELASEGVLDFLALTQEDAAPNGPHVEEQAALRSLIQEREVGDRVMIYPGADEAGMTLLVRFIHQHMLRTPTVAVVYSSEDGADRIAPFEDRPVRETVSAHIAATGLEEAVGPAAADICLFVSAPAAYSREEEGQDDERCLQRCSELEEFVESIGSQLQAERPTVVCDLAFPNGADPALTQLLFDNLEIHRLAAYAAWNTAGNSLGSALAHGAMRLIALQDKGAFDLAYHVGQLDTMRYLALLDSLIDSEKTHMEFLLTRFVDDWAYQALVRQRATEYVGERLRNSAFDLAEGAAEAEEFVRAQLAQIAHELYLEQFLGRRCVRVGTGDDSADLVLCELEDVQIRLPWGRLFEVDLDFDFGVQMVANRSPA